MFSENWPVSVQEHPGRWFNTIIKLLVYINAPLLGDFTSILQVGLNKWNNVQTVKTHKATGSCFFEKIGITSSGVSVLRQRRLIFDLLLYKVLTPFHGVKVMKPSNYVFDLEYEQLSIIRITQHSRSSKDISTTFKWSHSPKCTNLYHLRFAKYSSLWCVDGWCMAKINGFNWGFGWKRKKIYI